MTTIYSWRCGCDEEPLMFFVATPNVCPKDRKTKHFEEVDHAPYCAQVSGPWDFDNNDKKVTVWMFAGMTGSEDFTSIDDALRALVED